MLASCTGLNRGQRQIQVTAGVTKLARLRERARRDEVLQVPCSGSARGFRDSDVVFRDKAASEAVDSFQDAGGRSRGARCRRASARAGRACRQVRCR